jgi:hypothetical protein
MDAKIHEKKAIYIILNSHAKYLKKIEQKSQGLSIIRSEIKATEVGL